MKQNEEQLVRLAKAGDPRGVAELYALYFLPIYRFCYWQTNKSNDAEDLTQNIFIEMAKSIHGFQGKSSFKNWLYVLAKRQICDWLRQKYRLPTVRLLEDIPNQAEWIGAENVALKKETIRKLFLLLTGLEQKVMTERYLQRHTIKETAGNVGVSEAYVKVITHRSLKKLRLHARL